MKNLEKYTNSFKMKFDSFLTGCDALEAEGVWDRENLGEMEAFYMNDLTSVVIRLIASDGTITERETDYLNETFDFSYTREELVEVYNSCKEDIGHAFDETFENGITYMRKINDKLADAYKELLHLICEIIIRSDGIIAEAEVAEVKRLQALCA